MANLDAVAVVNATEVAVVTAAAVAVISVSAVAAVSVNATTNGDPAAKSSMPHHCTAPVHPL